MLDNEVIVFATSIPVTTAAYFAARWVHEQTGHTPASHPVPVGTLLIVSFLVLVGMDHEQYRAATAPLDVCLGAAIVFLSVPLVNHARMIAQNSAVVAIAVFVGSTASIATAITLPVALGTEPEIIASLAPKSATAPVATDIAGTFGGVVGLTATVAILTGVIGGVVGAPLLERCGVRDPRAVGLALGLASHAIGTARALQISREAGAFASLGMVLNAILTVALVPCVLWLLAI